MKRKKQNAITIAKRRFILALFNMYDFFMAKLEKIQKQKNIRNIIFPFCFFLFVFAMPANAYTLDQQTSDTGMCQFWNYPTATTKFTRWAQIFDTTQNNVVQVDLKFGAINPALNLDFKICNGTPINNASDINCNGNGSAYASSTFLVASSTDIMTVVFNPPIEVDSTKDYYFMLSSSTAFAVQGNNSGTVGHVCAPYDLTSPAPGDWLPSWIGTRHPDIWYKTYYLAGWYPLAVTLDSPKFGDRFINQAIVATGTVKNGAGLYNRIAIHTRKKENFTTLPDIFIAIGTSTLTFSTSTLASRYSDGNYEMHAHLHNTNTNLISIDSNAVDFVVGANTVFMGTSSPTTWAGGNQLTEAQICKDIATSTFFGGVECGLKKVVAWAIYPSPSSLTDMQNSYTNFKSAFPFNAYFQLTDTVTGAISTTTLNRAGTFDVPMINKQGQIITLPVVSSSSMAKAVGQTNADLIRNTITWAMWGAVAFLVFIQFKKF